MPTPTQTHSRIRPRFLIPLYTTSFALVLSCDLAVTNQLPATPVDRPTVSAPCGPGPLPAVENLPELPRVRLDTRYAPPTGGTTYQVRIDCDGVANCFTDVQSAVDAANLGDIVEVQAGATFTGNLQLPNKSGTGWLYIRTSAHASLPPPGVRVTPADASLMPKLITTTSDDAVQTAAGAHHYRLVGLEITTSHFPHEALVYLGDRRATTLDDLPSDIVLDRVYVHGDPTNEVYSGVNLHCRRGAIVDSYVEAIHRGRNYDAKAIYMAKGPGPFKIVNNYVEGSGENVMIGEGIPTVQGVIPTDIEICRNHFKKPLSWNPAEPSYAGFNWQVKNILEIKNGRRVLMTRNVFENNWPDAQEGQAILFTVRNTRGEMPWATVEDITFTMNAVLNSSQGFMVFGVDSNNPSQQTRRVLIHNNLLSMTEGAFLKAGANDSPLLDLTFTHNTCVHRGEGSHLFVLTPSGRVIAQRVVIENNIFSHGTYGVFGSGLGTGTIALDGSFSDYSFTSNVLYGSTRNAPTSYPPANHHPQSVAEVEFVDFARENYRLSPASPFSDLASDGGDIGADMEALDGSTLQ